MTVRIKTLEFTRTPKPGKISVLMYRVLSIRGVLTKDKLDPEYVASSPSFWLTASHRTIKLFDGTTLCVNGEYRMGVMRKILKAIDCAGDRLHKMNEEKSLAKTETGGEGYSERKRQDVIRNDVPIKTKLFRF